MSPTWVRRIAMANVVANVVIIVTGGAVRLTGSGLGCPSWPNCEPGSFHPTEALGVNGAIEWGNRMLGVVVGIIAALAVLAAWRRRPYRRSLLTLSLLLFAGIPVQGLIGGITVWVDLHPLIVGAHFLVSIGVLVAAVAFWVRSGEPDGPVRPVVPPAVRALSGAIIGAALVTIVLGVLVTGSGPHAGDPETPRLGFDTELISQLHADAVFLLLGLSVAAVFALRAVKAPGQTRRAAWWLLGVELAQGAIGYVQYFTDLPIVLVGAHMLGAGLLWIAVLLLWFATRLRDLPESADAAVG